MNNTVPGVYVGIVENNELDDEGRIEITLEGVSTEGGPHRARVATLMAGNGRGMQFLPENGDQVLVAFELGCFDRPIVIGSLWNKQDQPPEANEDGANNVKLIKTRSGNEIRIIDEDGKASIEIRSGGRTISITDDVIKLDGDVQITGKLEVGGDGLKTVIEKNKITGA